MEDGRPISEFNMITYVEAPKKTVHPRQPVQINPLINSSQISYDRQNYPVVNSFHVQPHHDLQYVTRKMYWRDAYRNEQNEEINSLHPSICMKRLQSSIYHYSKINFFTSLDQSVNYQQSQNRFKQSENNRHQHQQHSTDYEPQYISSRGSPCFLPRSQVSPIAANQNLQQWNSQNQQKCYDQWTFQPIQPIQQLQKNQHTIQIPADIDPKSIAFMQNGQIIQPIFSVRNSLTENFALPSRDKMTDRSKSGDSSSSFMTTDLNEQMNGMNLYSSQNQYEKQQISPFYQTYYQEQRVDVQPAQVSSNGLQYSNGIQIQRQQLPIGLELSPMKEVEALSQEISPFQTVINTR